MATGQRVWKRYPEGGRIGLGMSADRMAGVPFRAPIGFEDRAQERARVGVAGSLKYRLPAADLPDPAEIHHREKLVVLG
jgi:hypothetical protein